MLRPSVRTIDSGKGYIKSALILCLKAGCPTYVSSTIGNGGTQVVARLEGGPIGIEHSFLSRVSATTATPSTTICSARGCCVGVVFLQLGNGAAGADVVGAEIVAVDAEWIFGTGYIGDEAEELRLRGWWLWIVLSRSARCILGGYLDVDAAFTWTGVWSIGAVLRLSWLSIESSRKVRVVVHRRAEVVGSTSQDRSGVSWTSTDLIRVAGASDCVRLMESKVVSAVDDPLWIRDRSLSTR